MAVSKYCVNEVLAKHVAHTLVILHVLLGDVCFSI